MVRLAHSALWLALICQVGAAQQPDAERQEESAIRSAVKSYVEAFNRGDAAAVADHWSEQGTWVSPSGERFVGRDAIRHEMEAYFAEGKPPQIFITPPKIRFLAPTVAVEEGHARVTRPGEEASDTSYIAIHTKQGETWKMDSVRETVLAVEPETSDSNYKHLAELEWMIGEWVDQDQFVSIETTCKWSKNRNFITRSFAVKVGNLIHLEGTQVIGWDPVQKQIRSWLFDSEGGFNEAYWTRRDNRWLVHVHHTVATGHVGSSINIFTPVDENTFTFQSTGRELDGDLLPNLPIVHVVRKGTESASE